MAYRCEILADSIGPHGHRLTTFEVTFPRMILADMTRHRMISFSIESTRARPTEEIIKQVRNDPYVPVFRKRAKGMGGGDPLDDAQQAEEQDKWRFAALLTSDMAESMLHLSKEHVGRMLEPYAWTTGILSATEWDNFFALRCPPPEEQPSPSFPAQIELQRIAQMMEKARIASTPQEMCYGQWHLPLVTEEEKRTPHKMNAPPFLACGSAGRCAAVSYLNQHKDSHIGESVERWRKRLAPHGHWSPGEHPAECVRAAYIDHNGHSRPTLHDTGNFRGFKQLRKLYPNEAVRPRELQG